MRSICISRPSSPLLWLTLILLLISPPTYDTVSASTIALQKGHSRIWMAVTLLGDDHISPEIQRTHLSDQFQQTLTLLERGTVSHLVIPLINPVDCDFFHPDRFSTSTPDNFLFWALQIRDYTQIELLLGPGPFRCDPISYFDWGKQQFQALMLPFCQQSDHPLHPSDKRGATLIAQLDWLSQLNRLALNMPETLPLIESIVLDLRVEGERDAQRLINLFDYYCAARDGGDEIVPSTNPFPALQKKALLRVDQKDLALPAVSRFPLTLDLLPRPTSSDETTQPLVLPADFPSCGPHYLPPTWREDHFRPLLDEVYLDITDRRVLTPIYHSRNTLGDTSTRDAIDLATDLNKILRGEPCLTGPGSVTLHDGVLTLQGRHTFFRGGDPSQQFFGQCQVGQRIVLMPPNLPPIECSPSLPPHDNRHLELTEPVSLKESISNIPYRIAPLPIDWTRPALSACVTSRIHFWVDQDLIQEHRSTPWHAEDLTIFGAIFLSTPLFSARHTLTPIAPSGQLIVNTLD